MPVLPAVRLTAHLNSVRRAPASAEVVARAVVDDDAAHHVTDPDGLVGLDPIRANELDHALAAVLLLHPGDWVLALPRPGHLLPLRGPAVLTAAALEAGAAVVHADGGLAWVPQRVGPAIQWRLHRAERPLLATTPQEAERQLSETVLRATRALTELDLASGARPDLPEAVLPAAYGARAQRLAHRALLLLEAAEAGLDDDTEVLHSHAIGVRTTALRELRDAASVALCAVVSVLTPTH
ncbi:hypothetical protein GCM10027418_01510 [Mariniluteicoccus endophyticus]